jgi:hypothetical protein
MWGKRIEVEGSTTKKGKREKVQTKKKANVKYRARGLSLAGFSSKQ